MSVSPNYKTEGLFFDFSLSYDNIFNTDDKCFTLDIMEVSIFPSSRMTCHIGLITQFSRDVNIFDLYCNTGFTIYPFKKILSISGDFGFNYFLIILNHFSYIADIKLNIDIPIYKEHNLTFGAGLRHRNAIRIINYLKLNNYYNVYNSCFFEIAYRFIIK
jgi:hypothetical protein